MDNHLTPVNNRFGRKRQRDPTKWKRNIAKRLRYLSKSVPERVCEHNTKSLQCCNITMAQIQKLHDKFYAHQNKAEQDALILKYCSIHATQHKSGYKGKKQTITKFTILIGKKRVPICQKFFLRIFGITKHRVAYVMNRFFYVGDFATERRGGNRKDRKYKAQKDSVHKFIQKLECAESHYCRKSKMAERKYLSCDLNISKLYKIYKQSEYVHESVKKSYFRNIFNKCYNIGFGTPQTDVCSKCLELSEKIKNESDPSKKKDFIIEKRVHSLRAKAFFEKLQEEQDGLKIISFDCQKNLPLPKLPDQMTYYSRQLYFYNFTMVEGSSKQAFSKERVFSYVCTENQFHKDSNLVASAVYHRLTEMDKKNITHIRLVADGCGGQNKNCIVVSACCKWLLRNPSIEAIEIVFPETGHSFMPADRVFGVIEKKLKKLEVILHPNEIKEVIAETATLVELGKDCPISDWRDSVKNVIKQTTYWSMQFKECKRFILKRSKKEGNVLVRGELFYKSDCAQAVNICKTQKKIDMIEAHVLPSIVSIKKNKLVDINKLLCKHFGDGWIDLQFLKFYKELLESQNTLTAPVAAAENYCEGGGDDIDDLRI